jgi:hypothetical protein
MAAFIGMLACPAPARANELPQVSLWIDGIHSDEDGVAVMNALRQIPKLKVAVRPTTKSPVAVVVSHRGASYDLGDLARAVAEAQTPNRDKGTPSTSLVLRYKTSKGGADAEALARNLKTTCSKLKGVEAEKCRLDTERREVHIKLDGKGGARLSEIKSAFPGTSTD